MAAFKIAQQILLIFSPKMLTKNRQKPGLSIYQSRHRIHPFIYHNAYIKHYYTLEPF